MHVAKEAVPVKLSVPGATARQLEGFGDATQYGGIAAEYFSLAAGTDIAPLLQGLTHDSCHAPHWGYILSGQVVVTYDEQPEETCSGGDLFYWPPGHSVRVTNDADVILFSPFAEHVAVLDHMAGVIEGMSA
ncbi:MAG: cupin domain-containing protein [Acidimicrobiia bacterium]|nr:cupin domain-containing protein [Acidimicrobiia bacterium]